jgi:hypothetical protein
MDMPISSNMTSMEGLSWRSSSCGRLFTGDEDILLMS